MTTCAASQRTRRVPVEMNLMDHLFIINLYANLDDLARNLTSRRMEGDRRSIKIFNQFANRYVKTDKEDKDRIDQINRYAFRKILLNHFKYEFANKNDLNTFCDHVFEKMNITDNRSHFIKLRDEYKADFVLNISNKNKDQIYTILHDMIIQMDKE